MFSDQTENTYKYDYRGFVDVLVSTLVLAKNITYAFILELYSAFLLKNQFSTIRFSILGYISVRGEKGKQKQTYKKDKRTYLMKMILFLL